MKVASSSFLGIASEALDVRFGANDPQQGRGYSHVINFRRLVLID